MPKVPIAQATRYPSSVVLTFPYVAEMVEAIKITFSPVYRSYDPEARAWTIKAPHVDAAIALLRKHFPDATVTTFGKQTPPPNQRATSEVANPYAALHLLPTAPPEVVRAAYNTLVKKNHPDVVAPEQKLLAHQAMLRLNAAIEALRLKGAA